MRGRANKARSTKRALAALAAAVLAGAAWGLLNPGDYWPKFRPLIETLRAAAGLAALALAAYAAASGRALADALTRADAALRARPRRAAAALAAMTGAYVVVFASYSILRHERFNSSTYDLAVYDQAVWNTAHGHWLETTIEAKPGESLMLLGDHFAPILTLFAPVYWVWPSVRALLLAQTLLLAAGAWAAAAVARRRLRSPAAGLAFAAAYLLYPAVGFINRFDAHPAAAAVPAFLAAIAAAERGRFKLTALCLFAAMLCKEDMGLAAALFGLFLAFARGRRAWGFAFFAVGLAGSLLAMFVVLPAVRGEPSDTWERYVLWGRTPMDAAAFLLTHPLQLAQDVVVRSPYKLAYVLKTWLPLAFLPLLGWPALAIAAPAYGYNLASGCPSQSSVYFHYMAPIIPFVFYAAVLGAERAAAGRPARLAAALLAVAGCSVTAFALDCPLTKRITFPYWEVYGVERMVDADAARAVVARTPSGASVGATMALGPHVAHRRDLRLIWPMKSARLPNVDYLLLDLSDFRWNSAPDASAAKRNLVMLIAEALAKGYGLAARRGSVILLRRGAGSVQSNVEVMGLLDAYLPDALRELRGRGGARRGRYPHSP